MEGEGSSENTSRSVFFHKIRCTMLKDTPLRSRARKTHKYTGKPARPAHIVRLKERLDTHAISRKRAAAMKWAPGSLSGAASEMK